MEPPWEGGKLYINGPGHMTKMAIYGNTSNISYRTLSPMIMKLGMANYVLKLYKVYINDDPELTLTYSTTISNLAKLVFVLIVGHIYQASVYRTIGPLVFSSVWVAEWPPFGK